MNKKLVCHAPWLQQVFVCLLVLLRPTLAVALAQLHRPQHTAIILLVQHYALNIYNSVFQQKDVDSYRFNVGTSGTYLLELTVDKSLNNAPAAQARISSSTDFTNLLLALHLLQLSTVLLMRKVKRLKLLLTLVWITTC